jgi:hypothetical protein
MWGIVIVEFECRSHWILDRYLRFCRSGVASDQLIDGRRSPAVNNLVSYSHTSMYSSCFTYINSSNYCFVNLKGSLLVLYKCSMYVCMYVCMYVLCVCVCTHARTRPAFLLLWIRGPQSVYISRQSQTNKQTNKQTLVKFGEPRKLDTSQGKLEGQHFTCTF